MKVRAYLDLLRAHFIPAWILIFCAGYMSYVHIFGGFDTAVLVKAILIAVFGFEAGMVLNDYVDRNLDKKDVDLSLTSYFRPFKTRPLASGTLKAKTAFLTFAGFGLIAAGTAWTLPPPHRFYVIGIMVYSYLVEYFYQIKKRRQSFAWAQLVGRTDFALFPVAGYLVAGHPGINTILYFLYFYPLAQAHLAVNDLADWKNDKARGLFSVPELWGIRGTLAWICGFSLMHLVTATVFVNRVNPRALSGFLISYVFIGVAAWVCWKKRTLGAALKVLPLLHLSMAVQSLSLIFFKLI